MLASVVAVNARVTRATDAPDPNAPATGLGTRLLAVLAVAAAVVVANLYYNQPLLASMAGSFGASERAAGAIPAMTQLGYGLGMVALVPLGDMVERRGLIVGLVVGGVVGSSGLVVVVDVGTVVGTWYDTSRACDGDGDDAPAARWAPLIAWAW